MHTILKPFKRLTRQGATRTLVVCAISLAAMSVANPTLAQSQSSTSGSSNASQLSAVIGVVLVAGSIQSVNGSAQFAVTSIQAVGEHAVVGLSQLGASATQSSEASIRVSAQSARALGVAVGSTVLCVTEATGWALYASTTSASVAADKLISFLPNEIGKSLLHASGITYTK